MTKPYCAAPFKGLLVDTDGSLKPCCDFNFIPDSSSKIWYIHDISKTWAHDYQLAMHNPEPLRECSHCTERETSDATPGFRTSRQRINSRYNLNNLSPGIEEVELRFGNYCNLKCIMCGSYASSSIAQEIQSNKEAYSSINMSTYTEPTIRWWEDTDSMNSLYALLDKVKYINFGGGEPMLVPEFVDTLNRLNTDEIVQISLNTNLTKLNDNILTAFRRLPSINVMVSLEGIEEHNNYVRFGSVWEEIDKNIKTLLKESNVRLTIHHTLQHTSIYSLPKLIEYADKNNVTMGLHEVYYGSYPSEGVLTKNSVPPEKMDSFKVWLNSYNGKYKSKLESWISNYTYDHDLYTKFKSYVTMLDNIRRTNFERIFK